MGKLWNRKTDETTLFSMIFCLSLLFSFLIGSPTNFHYSLFLDCNTNLFNSSTSYLHVVINKSSLANSEFYIHVYVYVYAHTTFPISKEGSVCFHAPWAVLSLNNIPGRDLFEMCFVVSGKNIIFFANTFSAQESRVIVGKFWA